MVYDPFSIKPSDRADDPIKIDYNAAEANHEVSQLTAALNGVASGILNVAGTVPDKLVVHSDVSTTEASKPVIAIKGPVISSVPSIITAPF